MTALLPPAPTSAGTGLATTGRAAGDCPDLAAATLAALTRKLNGPGAGPSPLSLPEVNLRTKANLKGLLTKLGMGAAFGGGADFSRMSSQAASIEEGDHAATLRVDAQGTVASAATAVTIVPAMGVARPPIVFNRPYLLLVSAAGSSEPLFLARVANPDEP